MSKKLHLETLAIHTGNDISKETGSLIAPIHQTAAFEFNSAGHAADLFMLNDIGQIYSRMGNPTVDHFEKRMTALDGGVGAVGLASGMTAVTFAILNLCSQGDNIVTSPNLYGGVSHLFQYILPNLGIEVRFVDHQDPENFRIASDEKTRIFYGETLPNPRLNVFPIGEVAAIGEEIGIPLIIDNTCATPLLCRPFEFGAHITIYSATKYLCGQGSSIGGVVVDSGKFDWSRYPKRYPMMNDPDPSYHNLKWSEKFGEMAYIIKLRATMLRDLGGCMAPMNAFLFSQGLETLSIRMEKHCENAYKAAKYLAEHPDVSQVRYPGLPSTKETEERAKKYLGGRFGGMVGVDLKGGMEAAISFVNETKLFHHVANIGDVRSMVIHPASTTHSQVPADVREEGGITDGYLRLCIGIEYIDDILEDIEQALKKSSKIKV